jgi:hypothetical protein
LAKQFQRRGFFRNQPIRNLGRFSIKSAHLFPIRLQTWPPQAILVSDWLISKKKLSPLKPLGQMNRNLVGSIYNQSETRIACGGVMFVNGSGRNEQYL